jgi:hypothetical protein
LELLREYPTLITFETFWRGYPMHVLRKMIMGIRLKEIRNERLNAELNARTISTQTSFLVTALRGKWVSPDKSNPWLLKDSKNSVPLTKTMAMSFFYASAHGLVPTWVIELAPIEKLRTLKESN